MPRPWSTDLQEIFKASIRRDTLVLYLANNTTLYLSRGNVIRNSITYNNSIASISKFRTSIEAIPDRITITCQNVDSLLGFNIASNLRLLDYAFGEHGKIYQSLRNPSLVEDISQSFRGVLANAEVDETRISFELITDYESLGTILATRSLSPRCWWTYKNGIECTSVAGSNTCQKTRFACKKRGKEWEFGGFEFFEEPESNLPGTGGNEGGIGNGSCFTGDTQILTPSGIWTFEDLKARFDLGLKSIYSFNPQTGKIEHDEIEEIFVHQSYGFYTLEFEHANLHVTPEHPFFVDFEVFKKADDFERLDTTKIIDDSKTWHDSKLLSIKWNSDEKKTVYNCRVRKNNTYFANRCGVHNTKQFEI